jgi:hypothetical protein
MNKVCNHRNSPRERSSRGNEEHQMSKMADADEREENVDSMETGLLSHFLMYNVFKIVL